MPRPIELSRIEILPCQWFPPGYVVKVGHRTYLQVVEKVDHADGGVFMGGHSKAGSEQESIIAFFFTYFVQRYRSDAVDHQATIDAIQWLSPEGIADITKRIREDLWSRSISAGLCFNPYVVFFDKFD